MRIHDIFLCVAGLVAMGAGAIGLLAVAVLLLAWVVRGLGFRWSLRR